MNLCGVRYECACCYGVYEAPIENFEGFVKAVRLAVSMGREGRKFNIDKVPTVNACCPDCFQHIAPSK